MKHLITILTLTLISTTIWCQSNNVQPTNNTIIRLTIINDNGEILMRETQYGWMTLSMYYQNRQSIQEVMDSLANTYGIEISEPNLGGLFTYKYKFKTTSDIRQLYVAKYLKGELITPNKNEKLHWLDKDIAIQKLKDTVASLGEMTEQTLNYQHILWGGSFVLDRVDGKLVSSIDENFYPLTGN